MRRQSILITLVFAIGILQGLTIHYLYTNYKYRDYEYYLTIESNDRVEVFSPSSDKVYSCDFDSIQVVLLEDNR